MINLIDLPLTGQIYIGLSGGVDSVVLLDLTHQFFTKNQWDLNRLTAIYVNHQLQSEANHWQKFCQHICEQYQISFISKKIAVSPKAGESTENFARTHRYKLFFEHVKPDVDMLLLAHHLDDQAETVLFRLLKGAGPKGLSGMVNLYHYQNRVIYRPLLTLSKQTILDYASKNQLDYIQDPSNNLIDYDRNFLRKNILPALSSRFGAVNQTIARGANHYQQQQKALEYFLEQELVKIQSEPIFGYYCLDYNLFKNYPSYIQGLLLRKWFEKHDYKKPSEKKLNQMLHQFSTAKLDKIPEILWGEGSSYIIRKYQNKIFLNKKEKSFLKKELSGCNLEKKVRNPGERVYFLKKSHSVLLKKFLQQIHVPPWDRNTVALYFYQKKYLVAVEGYWVDEAFNFT